MTISAGDIVAVQHGGSVHYLDHFLADGSFNERRLFATDFTYSGIGSAGAGPHVDTFGRVYVMVEDSGPEIGYWERWSVSLGPMGHFISADSADDDYFRDGVVSRDGAYFYAGVQHVIPNPDTWEIRKYDTATGDLLDTYVVAFTLTGTGCIASDDSQVFWTSSTADRLNQFTFAGATGGELAGFATSFGAGLRPLHHFANGDFLVQPLNALGTIVLVDSTGATVRTFTVGDYDADAEVWGIGAVMADELSFWAPAFESPLAVGSTTWLFRVQVSDGALLDSFSRTVSSQDGMTACAVVPTITCTAGLLLGTDTGFIIGRSGVDTYGVVYEGTGDHSTNSEVIGFSGVAPVTQNIINTFVNFDLAAPLTSTDAGATWTLGSAPTFPSGFLTGVPLTWAKDFGGATWTIHDLDGRVYVYGQKDVGGSSWETWAFYSEAGLITAWTQGGLLSSSIGVGLEFGSADVWAVVILDDTVWWLDRSGERLARSDLAGTTFADWEGVPGTLPASPTVPLDPTPWTNYSMHGRTGTNRLIAWEWADDKALLTIDISSPSSPSFATSIDKPFGTNENAYDFAIVSNTVVIAVVANNAGTLGSIWRSTDGGATWTNIVASTAQLAAPMYANFISAIEVDPSDSDEIWAALKPPYVYHSSDAGLTWAVETVDMGIFTPYGGDAPSEWTGIVIGNTCADGGGDDAEEVESAVTLYTPLGVVVWEETEFAP